MLYNEQYYVIPKGETAVIEWITNIDFQILDWIQANLRCPFFDFLMPKLSFLGEWGLVWLVIGVVMLFFRKTRRTAVIMLISTLAVFCFGELFLKNQICRVRPCNVRPYIDIPVKRPTSYSFPSGHSSSSLACATSILMHHKVLGIFAMMLAFLIAFSRLYNYVHFPSDVLCGALLGALFAVIAYAIARKVAPRPRNRV